MEKQKDSHLRSSSKSVFSAQLCSIHSTVTMCGIFVFFPTRFETASRSEGISADEVSGTTICVMSLASRLVATRALANLARFEARSSRCCSCLLASPGGESWAKCIVWPLNSQPRPEVESLLLSWSSTSGICENSTLDIEGIFSRSYGWVIVSGCLDLVLVK
jgi:hypothetical protein